jgi:hypothetical protein
MSQRPVFSWSAYLPAAQSPQPPAPVSPFVDLPVGQFIHKVDPEPAAYVPLAQSVQAGLAAALENLPSSQMRQATEPGAELYPASQFIQSVAPVLAW